MAVANFIESIIEYFWWIKAVNAHSYNGYNAGALQAQANKNVDYMYAFADEFGLKVNESAWAKSESEWSKKWVNKKWLWI